MIYRMELGRQILKAGTVMKLIDVMCASDVDTVSKKELKSEKTPYDLNSFVFFLFFFFFFCFFFPGAWSGHYRVSYHVPMFHFT